MTIAEYLFVVVSSVAGMVLCVALSRHGYFVTAAALTWILGALSGAVWARVFKP